VRVPEAHDTRPFPPEVHSDQLCADTIATALASRGCLLVRDLLGRDVTNELVGAIDRTFAAFDDWVNDPAVPTSGPWFCPFKPEELSVHAMRPVLGAGGGILTADSPRLSAWWFEMIRTSGLRDLVSRCFGEPPVTSLTKCTLRRVRAGDGIEWHQDGAFLGRDSDAINVWVSLSDTSVSPGLDILGRRFEEIVPTGTHGARYDWSVGDGLVEELASQTPVARPRFEPGDALIFDGMLLHRTTQDPSPLPGTRYAIETWFFRPSQFPEHERVPIAF
jgi:hypothetical protein